MSDPQSQPMTIQQALQLAIAHQQAGRLPQAEALLRQILATNPNHVDALHQLGLLAMDVKRYEVAADLIGRAVALDPHFANAHNNLGNALLELGQNDRAVASIRRALELEPNSPLIQHNLGGALYAAGDARGAVDAFREAIRLKPDLAESYSCMGAALQYSLGELTQAEDAYRSALSINSNFAEARYQLGMVHLLRGDFARGWEEYESRFAVKSLGLPEHNFPQPLWDGSDLTGRRILITHEQGIGDTIQFSRYAPILAARGARVIVQCQPALLALLRSMSHNVQFIAGSDPVPDFDVHCPMLSLPRLCKARLDNIPNVTPYLFADPEKSKSWRDRVGFAQSGVKVGLCWAGSATFKNDRNRSISLRQLAPLANIPGVRFLSLQKGSTANESPDFELTDFTADLYDFSDTAALIDQLDLVISVDTAVAHLAGAMGKPVWTLLPFMPDWRWLLDRTDSPWYPTMKLFRQPKPGDWSEVVNQIALSLREFSSGTLS